MRELPVELDDETMRALEIERSLIGFESRSAYVRWLVEHRAEIDDGAGDGRLLAAYRERIAELEAELESIQGNDVGDESRAGRRASAGSDGDVNRTRRMDADGGWTRSASANATNDDAPRRDGIGDLGESDGIQSVNFTPERIERIRDDPVADDADVLGTIEVDRLDELSRRAVAKTRERLDRNVQTGLEYSSTTALAADAPDVRPGEDVTDLDELDLPGRSETTVERRREAAGHALAYLRDEGRARKSDFVDALYDEVPAGYDTTDGWWRCVKEALRQVDAVDGGDGSRVWQYTD